MAERMHTNNQEFENKQKPFDTALEHCNQKVVKRTLRPFEAPMRAMMVFLFRTRFWQAV